jgi:hypothetical protein
MEASIDIKIYEDIHQCEQPYHTMDVSGCVDSMDASTDSLNINIGGIYSCSYLSNFIPACVNGI